MVTECLTFGWKEGERNIQSLGPLENTMAWMPQVVRTLQKDLGTCAQSRTVGQGSEEGGGTGEKGRKWGTFCFIINFVQYCRQPPEGEKTEVKGH